MELLILSKSKFLRLKLFGDWIATMDGKLGSLRARDVVISNDSNGLAPSNTEMFFVLTSPSSSRDIARIKSLFVSRLQVDFSENGLT